MKTKHLLFLSLLLTLLASCSKEDSKTEYDYTVLGIKTITVGQTVIALDSCGFPVKGQTGIAIIGTGYGDNTPIRNYDLVVSNTIPEKESISVKSLYTDILVSIEKSTDAKYYNITVSRKGFDEKIIYKIGFLPKIE
jgi:hypothetical protein